MLKTGFRKLQLAIRLKQANFENPTHNFDAVSYTHLDVYKRQKKSKLENERTKPGKMQQVWRINDRCV